MDAVSTQTDTYAMHIDMARDARFPERITLPMLEGWTARIDAAREPDETRLDVIREAIDRELKRRKASRKNSDD